MKKKWSKKSWISHIQHQQMHYPDPLKLDSILSVLSQKQPLVSYLDILRFKKDLFDTQLGKTFIIQGGDCAECFDDCSVHHIHSQLKLLHQLKITLSGLLKKKVICIGRIAGQYAKPRTLLEETRGQITLPSYRGDLFHEYPFLFKKRIPNPNRLLQGYAFAQKTIDIIQQSAYPSVYYSHEALHLAYEEALIRIDANTQQFFLSSTHFPWIGAKTNFLNSAHIELLRGVINPIGLKVDEHIDIDALLTSILSLNPTKERNKIVLIHRFGSKKISTFLPPLIQALQKHHLPVLWFSDPMHGNTERSIHHLKTRHIDSIVSELEQSIAIHHQYNSHLHGIHLELTGEAVTECLGGPFPVLEKDLLLNYQSRVDPRLNYNQSLETIYRFGEYATRYKT